MDVAFKGPKISPPWLGFACRLLCFVCLSEFGLQSWGEVLHFPAGDFRIKSIVSNDAHFSLRGEGSGVTVLHVPHGIVISGMEPRIQGITLVGVGLGTGLTLKNCGRAIVDDVEIRGYRLGLLSLCEYGHRQWLHTYRDVYVYEGVDGNMKTYDKRIRGIELVYRGEKNPGGGWKRGGGFSNTHTFYGGRIAVPGTPLLIDGPTATTFFGTYFDMPLSPIRMTSRSAGLQFFGTHFDQSVMAKKRKLPVMILERPDFNRVKIFGQHQGLKRKGLIVDSEGSPVKMTSVFISPLGY